MGKDSDPFSDQFRMDLSEKIPTEDIFSDVLNRITRQRSLKELIGLLTDPEAQILKANITKIRAGGNPRFDFLSKNWNYDDR